MRSLALVGLALAALATASCHRTPAATTYHFDAKAAEPGTTYRWAFDPAPHFAPSPPSPIQATTPHERFFAVLGRWHVERDESAPSAPHVLRQDRVYKSHEAPRILVEHLAFASFRIKATCKVEGDGSCGVVFHAKDGEEYLSARFDPRTREVVLVRVLGDGETVLEKSTSPMGVSDEWHALEVTVHGRDAYVTVDGTLAFSAVLPESGGGLIGLAHRGEGVASFDDLEATAYKL